MINDKAINTVGQCPKCAGAMRMMVPVIVSAPASFESRISKKIFRRKDVEIWGVSWECARFSCAKCRYVERQLGNYMTGLKDENERLKQLLIDQTPLAKKHTGLTVSARRILGAVERGEVNKGIRWSASELQQHLEEMATRFYAGDVTAVDEFLQLYCLDQDRPSNV